MPRGRPKKPNTDVAIDDANEVAELIPTPSCPLCHETMVVNTPERWADEKGNYEDAWWNHMDYYCPRDHIFQNAREPNRYTQPSGHWLETGRLVIEILDTGASQEPTP